MSMAKNQANPQLPDLFSNPTMSDAPPEPGEVDPRLLSLHEHAVRKADRHRQKVRKREKPIERPEGYEHDDGIKSKERVQSIAEVLTPEREVNAMLDLVDDTVRDPRSRVLEPACGNGNFLEEIVARKLATVIATARTQDEFEFGVILALTNTYGIDIDQENVDQARARLRALVVHAYSTVRNTNKPRRGFYESVDYVLSTNIILGDSWHGADKVVMVEYSTPFSDKFTRRFFTLAEIERRDESQKIIPKPFNVIAATHFLELANVA